MQTHGNGCMTVSLFSHYFTHYQILKRFQHGFIDNRPFLILSLLKAPFPSSHLLILQLYMPGPIW
jgi:hypothetical protein